MRSCFVLFLTVTTAYEQMPDGCVGIASSDRNCNPRLAVDELAADGSGTHTTYGLIADWDMSLVTDMSGLFYNRGTFNGDISNWDTTSVTTMDKMFNGATDFNQDISKWNTAAVTKMNYMFSGASDFDQDISKWITTQVVYMNVMFYGASDFDQDLSKWTTTSVTDMNAMFAYAVKFNADISKWDTASVTKMNYMFKKATAFNSDISKWDTSSVATMDYMFYGSGFKRTLCGSTWDTRRTEWSTESKLGSNADGRSTARYGCCPANKYMSSPFLDEAEFVEDNSCSPCPDGTKVTDETSVLNDETSCQLCATGTCSFAGSSSCSPCSKMPDDCFGITSTDRSCNPRLAVDALNADGSGTHPTYGPMKDWDMSLVTDMSGLFYLQLTFNGDISKWDTANVTNMERMFYYASAFNGDISNWDTTSVTNMTTMFSMSGFNSDISNWNTDKVEYMDGMFNKAYDFDQDIGVWNTDSVTNMRNMFDSANAFNQDISHWNTDKVVYMDYMFYGANAFNSDISNWNTTSVTNMDSMFAGSGFTRTLCGSTWDSLEGSLNAFDDLGSSTARYGCCPAGKYMSSPTVNPFEVANSCADCNIGTFTSVLNDETSCQLCATGTCSTAGSSSCSQCSKMPDDCAGITFSDPSCNPRLAVATLNQDGSGTHPTYGPMKDWDMSLVTDMSGLFYGATAFNADISNWNTDLVTNMGRMFNGASVFNQDISKWNTAKVTLMQAMFQGAADFNQDISNWDTTSVTNMEAMFANAADCNQDIGGWTTTSVTNMDNMFYGAVKFNSDISKWDTANVNDMEQMFFNSGFKRTLCGSTWDSQQHQWSTESKLGSSTARYGCCPANKYMSSPFLDEAEFVEDNSCSPCPDGTKVTDETSVLNDETSCQLCATGTCSFAGSSSCSPCSKMPDDCFGITSTDRSCNPRLAVDALNADGSGTHPTYGPMKDWDMSLVTDMSGLFYGATAFNADISNWNTDLVTNMGRMFNGASVFNQDISKWDTSSVATMDYMFYGANAFNSDISGWTTDEVINMEYMFYDSGFKRTLCGSTWDSLKSQWSTSLGNSTARYGCCPANKYMSSPFIPFVEDNSCSLCPAGTIVTSETHVPNDETSCQTCGVYRYNSNGYFEYVDDCEEKCAPVPHGTCTNCTFSGCTAVTCYANQFNSDGNATNGCEEGCAQVPGGTCTACTSILASGCTAVTCYANRFNNNNIATDGCEITNMIDTFSCTALQKGYQARCKCH